MLVAAPTDAAAGRHNQLVVPARRAGNRLEALTPRQSRKKQIHSFEPTSSLAQACIEACRLFEAECKRTLSAEPGYHPGCAAFSLDLLALLAGADACRVTARAILRADDRLDEVCAWCAEVCLTCVRRARTAGTEWSALAAAGEQCVLYCSDLAMQTASDGLLG